MEKAREFFATVIAQKGQMNSPAASAVALGGEQDGLRCLVDAEERSFGAKPEIVGCGVAGFLSAFDNANTCGWGRALGEVGVGVSNACYFNGLAVEEELLSE